MNKLTRLLYLLIILLEGIVFYLITFVNITIPCLFKKLSHIPCPGCGLTRSFLSIFKLDLLSCLKYNLLGLPLFLFFLLINIFLIIDIIKNKNLTKNLITKLFTHYQIIIILLIISELLNIYHNV